MNDNKVEAVTRAAENLQNATKALHEAQKAFAQAKQSLADACADVGNVEKPVEQSPFFQQHYPGSITSYSGLSNLRAGTICGADLSNLTSRTLTSLHRFDEEYSAATSTKRKLRKNNSSDDTATHNPYTPGSWDF